MSNILNKSIFRFHLVCLVRLAIWIFVNINLYTQVDVYEVHSIKEWPILKILLLSRKSSKFEPLCVFNKYIVRLKLPWILKSKFYVYNKNLTFQSIQRDLIEGESAIDEFCQSAVDWIEFCNLVTKALEFSNLGVVYVEFSNFTIVVVKCCNLVVKGYQILRFTSYLYRVARFSGWENRILRFRRQGRRRVRLNLRNQISRACVNFQGNHVHWQSKFCERSFRSLNVICTCVVQFEGQGYRSLQFSNQGFTPNSHLDTYEVSLVIWRSKIFQRNINEN